MFLPGEGFYRAAIEADPDLLENTDVLIASPMILIALLRTIASIWNDEKVAESAREVNRLGQELYERLTTMTEHGVRPKKELRELEGVERSTQAPQTVELPVKQPERTALPPAADAA